MSWWDWAKNEGGNLVEETTAGAYNPYTGGGWANGESFGNVLHDAESGVTLGALGGSQSNPGGFLGTGSSISGSGIANTLEGNPQGYAAALQGLVSTANQQADQVKNFLLGREQQAQQYYAPMRQMFGQMYGTGGIKPAQAPTVPGSRPF